jgi:hypothetical protein
MEGRLHGLPPCYTSYFIPSQMYVDLRYVQDVSIPESSVKTESL